MVIPSRSLDQASRISWPRRQLADPFALPSLPPCPISRRKHAIRVQQRFHKSRSISLLLLHLPLYRAADPSMATSDHSPIPLALDPNGNIHPSPHYHANKSNLTNHFTLPSYPYHHSLKTAPSESSNRQHTLGNGSTPPPPPPPPRPPPPPPATQQQQPLPSPQLSLHATPSPT